MLYSQFTLAKAKKDFQLTTVEGVKFFPASLQPVSPSLKLQADLEDLDWAITVDSEKAKSEGIIYPVLQKGWGNVLPKWWRRCGSIKKTAFPLPRFLAV